MLRLIQLTQLGTILVSGPDARQFLQGQLSADLDTLSPQSVVLAACNSPQGRVQAIVWMIERSEGIALLVSRELLDTTLMRLRRYVLRSKVTLEAGALQTASLAEGQAPLAPDLQDERSHRQVDALSYLKLAGHMLIVSPPSSGSETASAQQHAWQRDYLRAGLPQVYSETHERFVAQMLNLDLLGGISFEKGCYTGQEIIARTHFRGAIKRRMFRYAAESAPPPPGTRVLLEGQHAGDVVDSIATEQGCELLAVANLGQAAAELELETNAGVPLIRQELPYALDGG